MKVKKGIPKGQMGNEMETRREYLTVQAIDPQSGKLIDLFMSHRRIQFMAGLGQGRILEAAYTVPEALQKPTEIFEGLCRQDDEPKDSKIRGIGWRCYCGVPSVRYSRNGDELSVRDGEVFVVFVTDDKVVYLWDWVKCDPTDRRLPIDHENRFKKRWHYA